MLGGGGEAAVSGTLFQGQNKSLQELVTLKLGVGEEEGCIERGKEWLSRE